MAVKANSLVRTHLTLERYAQILGINPVHFWSGFGNSSWPIMNNNCEDIWPRYSWQQADMVSHQQLALTIKEVEDDIARMLGYQVAPTWIEQEIQPYPQFYRKNFIGTAGRTTRGDGKIIKAEWDKTRFVGKRALAEVGTGLTPVFSDEDGDGFSGTATITTPTALTDVSELKLYHEGMLGEEVWEIRPIRSKSLSGGTLTIVVDSWLLLDPDLQARIPVQAGFRAIDVEQAASYVSEVDVYREYIDPAVASATFFWNQQSNVGNLFICSSCSGSGCAACQMTAQSGCIQLFDPDVSNFATTPAEYNTETEAWVAQTWAECVEPNFVKFDYKAGAASREFLRGVTDDPLDDALAQIIAMMATARLERPLCGCSNVTALADHWRTDVAFTGAETSFVVDFPILSNKFGTRQGELLAWRKLSGLYNRRLGATTI